MIILATRLFILFQCILPFGLYTQNDFRAQLIENVTGDSIPDLLPARTKRAGNSNYQEPIPEKKGFLLTDLRLPLEEIHDGGPPPDGIPSIDKPGFRSVASTDHVEGKDLLLVLEKDGLQKAYPLFILDRHEIVNDRISDISVVITYCPLCHSGIVFHSRVGESVLQFGVSGLLYNSDVLLYDRQTKSLWSQVGQEAIAGEYSGTRLEVIPSLVMNWTAFRARYPGGLVLDFPKEHFIPDKKEWLPGQRKTLKEIIYARDTYKEYRRSERIWYPVKNSSKRLGTKEEIIGICLSGTCKAYPISSLSGDSPVHDRVGNYEIEITYSAKDDLAVIRDSEGRILPAIRMYWFAWFAFHPGTILYSRD